jgi:superoxide dismutase, Cu-Zn family
MRLAFLAVILSATISSNAWSQDFQTIKADMIGNSGAVIGQVVLRGGQAGVVIRLSLRPGSVTPGWHGIHLHMVGDCSDHEKFLLSKGHLNHAEHKHGLLNDFGAENGDLPNVFAATDGSVNAELFTAQEKLGGGPDSLFKPGGAALVIHAGEDDHVAQPIGNSGARVGCAVLP